MKGYVGIIRDGDGVSEARCGRTYYQFGSRLHDASKVSEHSHRRMERALMNAIRWTTRLIGIRFDRYQSSVVMYYDPEEVRHGH